MDEDNGLWGFKNIDEGAEQVRRDQPAEHQRPRIRYMTGFEPRRHAAVCDLDDEQHERDLSQLRWQGPFCRFRPAGEAISMAERSPERKTE